MQEKYNMLDRDLETAIVPLCLSTKVSILSYASLATGLLSGKLGPERKFEGDDQRIGNPRFTPENREKTVSFLNQLSPIAEKYGLSITNKDGGCGCGSGRSHDMI